MRRIIPFVIAMFLVFSCALPVSAADLSTEVSEAYWIELLDYTQAFPAGNYANLPIGKSRVTISLPRRAIVTSIDILAGCYHENVKIYYVHPTSGPVQLKKLAITGVHKTYRFYLDVGAYTLDSITLEIDTGTEYSWIDFYQVNVASKPSISVTTPLNGSFLCHADSYSIVKNPAVSTPSYAHIPALAADYNNFTLTLCPTDWRKYDYIDFRILLDCLSVTSVSASFGGVTLPIEVNTILGSSFETQYYVRVTVDLRGLNRAVQNNPYIYITGDCNIVTDSYVNIVDSYGIVLVDNVDPLYYYFKSITDSVKAQTQDIVSALSPPASDKVTDYKDSATIQAGKVDDITTAMGSVNKPAAGDLNFSMSALVSQDAVSLATLPLTVILENKYIKIICIMSFTLCIAGYILFGKKG